MWWLLVAEHRFLGCVGFSKLQPLGSRAQQVVVHGFSCSVASGDLPRSGIEPMLMAMTGGFFTTEPPGKARKL